MDSTSNGGSDRAEQRGANDFELDVIAVNDNGRALLQWFRSLPPEEQTQIFTVAKKAAAKLQH